MSNNILIGAPVERFLENVSLGELILNLLESHENNVLLIDAITDEQITASELLNHSICLANWLTAQGVGIGDAVSVNSKNCIEFAFVPLAAFLIGATFAPLNPEYTPGELKHVLNLSKPKVVFCSFSVVKKMVQMMEQNAYIQHIVVLDDTHFTHSKVIPLKSIIKDVYGGAFHTRFRPPAIDTVQTVATILCSSGTTGLPKGVMCTHDNMTSFLDIMRTALSDMIYDDIPHDSMLGIAPFFHSMGFMILFLNILRGKRVIIFSRFRVKSLLDAIVKYKINRLVVPPPILVMLLKDPLTATYDLSNVCEIRSGAAPLGKDIEQALLDKFKVRYISQSYGMTETTLAVLVCTTKKMKPGCVGRIVPGMMIKVIDPHGNALGPYKDGEICVKGPLVMKGYVNDERSTNDVIDTDGWLHTGDVAHYDDEGDFFIVDRIKELIKYKGFQVAPAEIEALLLTHAHIKDAAVVGVADELSGELPLAFVVRRNGAHLNESEVEQYVADNLSTQKKLRGGVIFVDSIPKNPSGKILRRHLKESAKKLKCKY